MEKMLKSELLLHIINIWRWYYGAFCHAGACMLEGKRESEANDHKGCQTGGKNMVDEGVWEIIF